MAKNPISPNYSQLSGDQITQQVFDPDNDALRIEPLVNGSVVSGSNPSPVTNLPFVWDYVSMALSAGNTTETFTYKSGGSGGTTTGTVTVVYTTSARDVLVNATIVAV